MMVTIIIAFFGGIALGLLLAISPLWIFQISCPKCKNLQPAKEIILFHWKEKKITGQLCQKCQKPKAQIDLDL